jgi:hypothetical protein
MNNRKLRKEFEYVRKSFFPLWGKKREWRIKKVWHLPSKGRYDNINKRILIKFIPDDKEELYGLLIHEISHLASSYHGKKYLNRLSKARDRAKQLGLKTLAEIIQDDVRKYTECQELYDNTYQMIQDAVMDVPKISWTDLLRYAAHQRGMYPKEFLRRYKRAKKIFLSAKKEIKEEREAKARFEKIIQDERR